jgi:hypothetical protein
MPVELLNTVMSLPLEREFEGWITWTVLDYLEEVGIDARIWSISPQDEHTWPADETLLLEGKVIGLQFKRPYLADPLQGEPFPHYNRLYWPLGHDPAQFRLVKANEEIFYCLPTFTNRTWRKASLHHCLFWRPTRKMGPGDVWYENSQNVPGWSGSIDRHYTSFRWGAFFERLVQCSFGWRVTAEGPIREYHMHLRSAIRAAELEKMEEGERESLLFFNVGMEMTEEREA